jgi:anionic cell wall polymer biosynthesis LytR-Cps2A-Psr (LCP) family protein
MFFSSSRSPKALSPMRRLHIVVWMLAGIMVLLCATVVFSSRVRVLAIRSGLMMAGAEMTQSPLGLTNLLIVGTGDRGHDGADLTDTMIVASLDPAMTRSTVLLSLPRDLYIRTAGETAVYGRINTLYFLEKSRLKRTGLDEEEASVQALGSVGRMIGEKLGMEMHGVSAG